jgi:hypothetical protein
MESGQVYLGKDRDKDSCTNRDKVAREEREKPGYT